MISRQPSPCHLCARFHRQDNAPAGHGMCSGFDKLRRYDDTNEACVLFNAAKDEAQRKRWAEQQKYNNKGLEK